MTQIHQMSPGWQGLYKRMQQRDHQGAKPPFWRETWFYEQIVYVLVCLTPAAFASWHLLASKGPLTTRDAVLLVGTMLGQFLAQKARSVASRQSALLKGRGVYVPEVRCAPEMRKWIAAGQVLGAFMSVATAPTWWHLPSILWAAFAYDLWREYREARKLRQSSKVTTT